MDKFIEKSYNNIQNIANDNNKINTCLKQFSTITIKNIHTIVGNTEIKIKLFCLYIITFYIKSQTMKKLHVGIDFEFNNNIIALMQINFFAENYIWIVNPGNFTNRQKNILVKYLLLNNKVYKILHGSESLDIPYIYSELLENNKNNILKFTSKLFDTRFLCEYYKSSINYNDNKCSLYYALKYFDVVTDKEYNYLNEINKSMGPIQYVKWDVNKLDKHRIKYALYDVLYLEQYLRAIFNFIITNTPTYIKSYKYIIEIIRFVFVERRGVTNIVETAKTNINRLNNYSVMFKNKKSTLIDIYNNNLYNNICENIKNSEENIDINFIQSISYFKKYTDILFKNVVYHVINNNKNNNNFLKLMYKELEINHFNKIIKLLQLFEKATRKYIV
jgi:hypothetical protein